MGVLLNEKLSWTPHIHWICTKANYLLGFLYRNLHYCPPNLKEHAYKQIVLPSIEYCSTLWDPHQQSLIEMLQHHVARSVLNKPRMKSHRDSITIMSSSLNWPPLEKHRRHLRLILLFKFLNGIIHIPSQYLPAPSHYQAGKLMWLYARSKYV